MLDQDQLIVVALVVAMLVLFFREAVPIPLTALLATVVLMATGVLSTPEGLSGFGNPATVAVLAMFVLSAGIQQTGAVSGISRALTKWAGPDHRRQLLALGAASGPASAFINNTPIVAILIPPTIQMARRSGVSPSRLLLPVSHFAMLGGTITVIGTSTNILGNATLGSLGYEPFGLFEFFWVGLGALAVGVVYYLTLGARLLPDRGQGDFTQRFDLKGFLAELQVPEHSKVVGHTIREAKMTFQYGAQVLRIARPHAIIDAPDPGRKILAGDILLVEASRQRLATIATEQGLTALPQLEHPLSLDEPEPGQWATAEVVITSGSRYVGRTVAEIDFRNRYEALVLALRHQGRIEIGPISQSSLRPGDVLLVQASVQALDRMREKPDLFVTRERAAQSYRTRRMPHAVSIVALVVILAATGLMDISVAALTGAVLMVLTGTLRMDEFLSSVHWDIILLLAGIIPVGLALEKTGLAALLADQVVHLAAGLPPVGFLIAVFILTSLITEVVSNNASVVLLVPVAVVAAIGLGYDARPVALSVILAASTSMMTPIGYQTNTMIYAPGNYRFSDYFRVGAPLNLILAVTIPLTIAYFFPLVPAPLEP